MKKFISNFCLRGLIAMGFGPIVYGCIMLILHLCNVDTTSDGLMIFKGIISFFVVCCAITSAFILIYAYLSIKDDRTCVWFCK